MTTILADFRLGVVVTDSSVSDGDRVWSAKKTYRHKGMLIGFSGDVDESLDFMTWWRGGGKTKNPRLTHSEALIMSPAGLVHYSHSLTPMPVKSGMEAIGSGAKAAMAVYESQGWHDPVKAVRIVCRHDSGSRSPVRVYKLRTA